jgi:hypothetical protein
MTITSQTPAEIKNAVTKVYQTVFVYLNADKSNEGVDFVSNIDSFLDISSPTFSDLVLLRETIYEYKNQLVDRPILFRAASDLQTVIATLITEKQFGYTALNQALATDSDEIVTFSSAIGDESLETNSTTIIGGINELKNEIINIQTLINISSELTGELLGNEVAGDLIQAVNDLNSAVGSSILNTTAQNVADAINELEGEIDILQTNVTNINNDLNNYAQSTDLTALETIVGNAYFSPGTNNGPQYLNRCTLTDDVYTVGRSVFYKFDSSETGPALSTIPALQTVTGYISAMAQCATWQLELKDHDLYLTTNNAAGVTEDTGCTQVLDMQMANAYCNSVFDTWED